MNIKIAIGKWEAVCVLLNTINIQIFLNLPRYISETGGTAGWILAIYIFAATTLIFSVVLITFRRFPRMDIVDIANQTTGRIGQIIVGLSFSLLSFIAAAIVLREFSENIKTISLTVSPLSYTMMFFLLGMIIAAFVGFEIIIRFQGFAIPIIAVGYFFIIMAVSPLIRVDNLAPILGNGLPKIFGEGFLKISLFIGISISYWLPPFLKTYSNFRSVCYWSLSLSGFFVLLAVVTYSSIIPYPTATESLMPIYDLSRLINQGRFFQRIEALFLSIWILSAFLYLSSCFYCSIYGFRRAFSLPYTRPLIIPFSILVYNAAFLPSNIITAIELDKLYLRTFGFLPAFGIPIILLIISWLRKKGGSNIQASTGSLSNSEGGS